MPWVARCSKPRISIVGFLIFLWGLMRLAGGRKWGERRRFRSASWRLQFRSTVRSIGFWLRMCESSEVRGWPSLRHRRAAEWTQLVAPDGRYITTWRRQCSGVRSLTALAALSLLLGYLNFRSWRRRHHVAALLSAGVSGNVARISSIVLRAVAAARRGANAHTP